MFSAWFEITLWKRIMAMLVLGIIFGALLPQAALSIDWIGELFIRLIRMIVVPLVFITLVSGVVAMGDPKKLGSLGAKTLIMYMGTTLVAITIGLTIAAIIQPGVGVDLAGTAARDVAEAQSLKERLLTIVPLNPVSALAEGNMLAIIFFALLLGCGVLLTGKKGKSVADLFESGSEVMLKITHLVMEVAPFGVFSLISGVVATGGLSLLLDVLPLVITFLSACIIHVIVTHGAIMKFLLKLPPSRFFRDITGAQLVAFSTSSSSGTLPVTMTIAEENLGIKKPVAGSVLPLGATINMDGSALYVGILAVFSAQVLGIEMGLAEYLLIALSATLASIGTAAVPSASLFLLAAVLSVLNIDAAQTAIIVGFIFPFDRPLDMCRTVVNVTGDLSVATAVAKWEGELDEGVFKAEPVD
ncbi:MULTISPECIES: dicarboxylate/amino acid:cation symporter [Kordiimonas]|jgi:Na+/H+-dicarboxylate symporter|uniref:dicarboxylate/amino acid:cation symporter n=1 Tax=Kordiimonas TaxID=288021 RepID=UPI00257D3672|nr:dicarboxylate/amino acid:cation symporter [Kordiimonas sp. UBA4487]